jgi:hypothetical protein
LTYLSIVLSIICVAAPTDQFTQLAHRSQEAFSAAARAWQNTLRSYPGATPSTEAMRDINATGDAAFDLAARVLADQREFTKALVSVATMSFKTITEQATQIADQAGRGTEVHPKAHASVRPTEPADLGTPEADVRAKADAPARPAEQPAAVRTEPASGPTGAAPAAAPKRPRDGRRTDDA